MQLSVVILAAGQGQRMHSDRPKVLQPLAGKPLIQHVVAAARSLHPQDIHIVYGHGGAEVQAALSQEPVEWILQAEQLGTGHAVMQAMPLIPDEHVVLVLYGDVPLVRPDTLRKLLAAAADGALAILSAHLSDPAGYGRIVRDAAGALRAIVEHKDASPAQLAIHEINTGLMAVSASRLRRWLLGLRNDNALQEYYLTDVAAAAVQEGVAVVAVGAATESEVMGVNDKVQLAAAETNYRAERARDLMVAGATLADPLRIDVRGELDVGRDVFIDVNAVFVGKVTVAAGATIGPNCLIQNSEIGAGAEILANCVIDGAVIGPGCRVGPFARLRPGTVLHREVHIGNFVEVKNSEIGAGSKANHLTYLGDAKVGIDVNVGAGSITCNYDGENKWPTQIGDGAFIGSGNMLVAPLQIGAGATTGAGSTLVGQVPAGKLTLSRAKQMTITGWIRPVKFKDDDKAAAIDAALGKKGGEKS
jgi:bifunctional UDP-N-acetylglucosamine pyrophosphorylase/glucosamine-1-phosphate N-acetyltransferase